MALKYISRRKPQTVFQTALAVKWHAVFLCADLILAKREIFYYPPTLVKMGKKITGV